MKILIIGHGLAGATLAHTLMERGHEVMVIDKGEKITSSKVAAGMFNPITGMNRSKTWLAEDLFPFLKKFYTSCERQFGTRFLYELPIYMPFTTIESQNEWIAKSAESYWKNWIDIRDHNDDFAEYIKTPHGAMQTKHSGWVDTKVFLENSQRILSSQNRYKVSTYEGFEESSLKDISFEGQSFDKMVFCDGLHGAGNPLFGWLNHATVKGNLFEVAIPDMPSSHIINKNGFLMPLGNHIFRAGSTYNNFYDDPVSITKEGFEELKNKIDNILACPYEISKHYAATRPATKDRKPLLGAHPKYANIYIFNGLGTKGVSLAPYFASQLVSHMEGNAALFPEVDIQRNIKYYASEHQNV